jgi:predicted HTH transcriptional regulator
MHTACSVNATQRSLFRLELAALANSVTAEAIARQAAAQAYERLIATRKKIGAAKKQNNAGKNAATTAKVFKAVKSLGCSSAVKIGAAAGLERTATTRYLENLLDEGKVERVGTRMRPLWQVKAK